MQPLGAPFPTSDVTVSAFETIENLPEGSIVVIGGSGAFAFDLESSAANIPAIQQMANKGLKLVNVPLSTEAVQFQKYLVDGSKVDSTQGGPWEYGVDWVQLPYLPGQAAALVSLLEDVHDTISVDVYGTPLEELPLMQEFRNHEDISLWICPHWGFPDIARYVTGEKGITSISFCQAGAYAMYTPYMMAYPGKIFLTNGFLGGAQYERLMGVKGLGHAAIDGYAVISAVLIIFILLGNIKLLTSGREEEM
jgi:hypothetical protein